MLHKASDVALAETRALILDRTRWPGEVLIGAGATWLREGAMASMFEQRGLDEERVAAVRMSITPVGMLDALEISRQVSAYVVAAADALRALDQPAAAQALEAESFAPDDDPSFAEALKQFRDVVAVRVTAERPATPAWLGQVWTAVDVAVAFGRDADALDEMGAGGLDQLLDRIEAAQADTERRIAWLRSFGYNAAPVGAYDADPLGSGILPEAMNAGFALGNVHSAATQALGRAEIPREWTPQWITDRLLRMLATRAPALAADLMGRTPPVKIVDRWPA